MKVTTPDAALIHGEFEFIVATATRAPSVHNTQPWRFGLADDRIELWADRSRTLPFVDPDGREMAISCGAALFGARLAIRCLGREPVVRLCPDRTRPDLLATIELGAVREVSDADRRTLDVVARRHTHRGPFAPLEMARPVLVELRHAAEEEGAQLLFVEQEGKRRKLAGLLTAADRLQRGDPATTAELKKWTRAPRSTARDGVPATSYPKASPHTPEEFPPRDFAVGRGWGYPHDEPPPDSAAVVVLATQEDRLAHWLMAGQALQNLLLHAAQYWAFAAIYTQPMEVAHIRQQVRDDVTWPAFPQVVMRIGYSTSSPTTPRRSVADVIDFID